MSVRTHAAPRFARVAAVIAASSLALCVPQCRSFPPPPPGFSVASFDQLASDPTLSSFALEQGAAIFRSECARCHGDDRRGTPGFPDLGDGEWIWGAGPEAVAEVVRHGVRVPGAKKGEFAAGTRHAPDQTPPVAMPPYDDVLSDEHVAAVADFTARLIATPLEGDPGRDPSGLGADVYAQACAACHGARGEGRPTSGFVRLRGGNSQVVTRDRDDLEELVRDGVEARTMKAFAGTLSEDEIRCVALFVAQTSR